MGHLGRPPLDMGRRVGRRMGRRVERHTYAGDEIISCEAVFPARSLCSGHVMWCHPSARASGAVSHFRSPTCPMGRFGRPMGPLWDVQRRVQRRPTPLDVRRVAWGVPRQNWTSHASHGAFWMSRGTSNFKLCKCKYCCTSIIGGTNGA